MNIYINFLRERKIAIFLSASNYILFSILGIFIARNSAANIHYNKLIWNDIFIHNMTLGLMLTMLGMISFGIINTSLVSFNALLFGMSIMQAYNKYGFYILEKLILPHALLEISAIVIFSSLGYEIYYFIKYLKDKKQYHLKYICVLFVFGTFLMLVSSIIESMEVI